MMQPAPRGLQKGSQLKMKINTEKETKDPSLPLKCCTNQAETPDLAEGKAKARKQPRAKSAPKEPPSLKTTITRVDPRATGRFFPSENIVVILKQSFEHPVTSMHAGLSSLGRVTCLEKN